MVGFGITPSRYAMTVMNVLPSACLQSVERMMSDGWMLRHQGGTLLGTMLEADECNHLYYILGRHGQ